MRKSVNNWASPFFGNSGEFLSFTSDPALASKEELEWSGFCWASSDQYFRLLPWMDTMGRIHKKSCFLQTWEAWDPEESPKSFVAGEHCTGTVL